MQHEPADHAVRKRHRVAAPAAAGETGSHLEPYRGTLARVGPAFESLHWHGVREQEERFEAIAEIVPLRGRVVADIGCGRGDLLAWLRRHRLTPGRYVGLDALPGMIEFAAARHSSGGRSAAAFVVGDFIRDRTLFEHLARTHNPDVLLFSGSLNTYDPRTIRSVLDRAWRSMRLVRGRSGLEPTLVFNFLNERITEQPGDPSRAVDSATMLAWAMTRAREVASLTGYVGGLDTTIAMAGVSSRSRRR